MAAEGSTRGRRGLPEETAGARRGPSPRAQAGGRPGAGLAGVPESRAGSQPVTRGAGAQAPKHSQRTLTLSGNIDVTTDEAVRDSAARCLHDQPDVLVIDLRELNFCDSRGVRALRWVLRRAALVGATVRVIPPGEHVLRMLALLGASDLLAVIDSAGTARAGQAGPLP